MSGNGENNPIPNKFLCRRCNFTEGTLTDEGLVACSVSNTNVAPVERRLYQRFELCPQRTETARIPSCKLKLLASFARRLRRRYGTDAITERLVSAEAAIRADLQVTSRL